MTIEQSTNAMHDTAFAATAGPIADRLSKWALAGLAAAHLAALAVFLLAVLSVAGRAHAETVEANAASAPAATASCEGRDLLDVWRKEDPARLARLEAEAAKVVNGDSRFWKIEKPGTDVAPSYLFGTMHVTDPRVLAVPDTVKGPLAAAKTIVIETADILDPVKAQAAILMKPDLTMFTDGTTIDKLLAPKDLAVVKGELDRRGIPLALVSRMKPWMIASLVALPVCEQARKEAGDDFLDKRIALDAKAAGKSVEGLETLQEQLAAMASLPMEFHLRGLVETIALGSLMDDVTTTMTDLYLDGRIGMILPMMRSIEDDEGADKSGPASGEGYAAFEEQIILKRNAVMAERSAPIIDRGNAFIAVGALHLPGDKGVVERLRKAGYTLTPVR